MSTGLCNHQDAAHITAILGESVVFNCHVDFPDHIPVPYVLTWRKKINDEVRYRAAAQQAGAPSLLAIRELRGRAPLAKGALLVPANSQGAQLLPEYLRNELARHHGKQAEPDRSIDVGFLVRMLPPERTTHPSPRPSAAFAPTVTGPRPPRAPATHSSCEPHLAASYPFTF
jgi:hypothetical protein